ncbi:hypothetical protein FGO68_gene3570 [Halteria grandinella]|uniref:Uncharacterized protein n=1 Tax=Halteria grandinella TaxID=5974 RepID=A0A8J8P4C8_HALGN|nr:hypothetical protein FGO68_gene3570 [Halteria grandinella]
MKNPRKNFVLTKPPNHALGRPPINPYSPMNLQQPRSSSNPPHKKQSIFGGPMQYNFQNFHNQEQQQFQQQYYSQPYMHPQHQPNKPSIEQTSNTDYGSSFGNPSIPEVIQPQVIITNNNTYNNPHHQNPLIVHNHIHNHVHHYHHSLEPPSDSRSDFFPPPPPIAATVSNMMKMDSKTAYTVQKLNDAYKTMLEIHEVLNSNRRNVQKKSPPGGAVHHQVYMDDEETSEEQSNMARNFYGGSKIMNIQIENGRAVGADIRPITNQQYGRESEIGSRSSMNRHSNFPNPSSTIMTSAAFKPYTSQGFRTTTPTPSFILSQPQLAFNPIAQDNTPGGGARRKHRSKKSVHSRESNPDSSNFDQQDWFDNLKRRVRIYTVGNDHSPRSSSVASEQNNMLLRPLIPRKEIKYTHLKPIEAKLPPLPSPGHAQLSTLASVTSGSKMGTPEYGGRGERKIKKKKAMPVQQVQRNIEHMKIMEAANETSLIQQSTNGDSVVRQSLSRLSKIELTQPSIEKTFKTAPFHHSLSRHGYKNSISTHSAETSPPTRSTQRTVGLGISSLPTIQEQQMMLEAQRIAKMGPPPTKKQMILKKKGRIMNLKLFQKTQERQETLDKISRNVAILTGKATTNKYESLESTIGFATMSIDENSIQNYKGEFIEGQSTINETVHETSIENTDVKSQETNIQLQSKFQATTKEAPPFVIWRLESAKHPQLSQEHGEGGGDAVPHGNAISITQHPSQLNLVGHCHSSQLQSRVPISLSKHAHGDSHHSLSPFKDQDLKPRLPTQNIEIRRESDKFSANKGENEKVLDSSKENSSIIHFEDQKRAYSLGLDLSEKEEKQIIPTQKRPPEKTHMMTIQEIMKKKKGLTINTKPITAAMESNQASSPLTFEKAEQSISGLEGSQAKLGTKEAKLPIQVNYPPVITNASPPSLGPGGVGAFFDSKRPWGVGQPEQSIKKNMDLLQQRSDGTIVSILNPQAPVQFAQAVFERNQKPFKPPKKQFYETQGAFASRATNIDKFWKKQNTLDGGSGFKTVQNITAKYGPSRQQTNIFNRKKPSINLEPTNSDLTGYQNLQQFMPSPYSTFQPMEVSMKQQFVKFGSKPKYEANPAHLRSPSRGKPVIMPSANYSPYTPSPQRTTTFGGQSSQNLKDSDTPHSGITRSSKRYIRHTTFANAGTTNLINIQKTQNADLEEDQIPELRRDKSLVLSAECEQPLSLSGGAESIHDQIRSPHIIEDLKNIDTMSGQQQEEDDGVQRIHSALEIESIHLI